MVFCIISWLEIQSCVLKGFKDRGGENEGVVGTEVIAWEFVWRGGRKARSLIRLWESWI